MISRSRAWSLLALTAMSAVVFIGAHGWAIGRSLEVRVHPDVKLQTINGWEVTLPLSVHDTARGEFIRHDFPEGLFDVMAAESGINRLRMEIRSGAERPDKIAARFIDGDIAYESYRTRFYKPFNDNDDPFDINPDGFDFSELDYYAERFVKPFLERDPDRKIEITLCYVHFSDEPVIHLDPDEYAELMLAAFRHLETRWGLVPDLIEVILEPDNVPNPIFIPDRVANIISVTGARLNNNGYEPRFIVGSVLDPENAMDYLDAVEALPAALSQVAEVDYHRYRGARPQTIGRLYERARALGVATAMLEWWDPGADGSVLLEDLTIGGVSSWQNAYFKDFVSIDEGDSTVMVPRFRGLSAAFRNIPRGSVRLDVTGRTAGRVAAFQRPDGTLALLFWSLGNTSLSILGFSDGSDVEAHLYGQDGAEQILAVDGADAERVNLSIPETGLVVLVNDPDRYR